MGTSPPSSLLPAPSLRPASCLQPLASCLLPIPCSPSSPPPQGLARSGIPCQGFGMNNRCIQRSRPTPFSPTAYSLPPVSRPFSLPAAPKSVVADAGGLPACPSPTAYCLLPIASCPFPAVRFWAFSPATCSLPAHRLLPTAHSLQPVSGPFPLLPAPCYLLPAFYIVSRYISSQRYKTLLNNMPFFRG